MGEWIALSACSTAIDWVKGARNWGRSANLEGTPHRPLIPSVQLTEASSEACSGSCARFAGGNRLKADRWLRYVLLVPAFVVLLALFVYPIIYAFHSSLYTYLYGRPTGFVGFRNWGEVFGDRAFWLSILRTLIYSVIAIPIELVVGLGLALLYVDLSGRLAGILRTIVVIPFIVMPIVTGIIWKLIFLPHFGVADVIESSLGLKPLDWLGTAKGATASVIIMDFWMWIPFVFLIMLAGLQSQPDEPYEAAVVDGANPWQRFVYVTLPLLKPTILVAATLRTIDAIRIFDQVYSMTGGGPGVSTEFVSLHVAQVAFNLADFGHASVQLFIAFGVMLVLVGFFYSLIGRENV